jgi:hypothetical protein
VRSGASLREYVGLPRQMNKNPLTQIPRRDVCYLTKDTPALKLIDRILNVRMPQPVVRQLLVREPAAEALRAS